MYETNQPLAHQLCALLETERATDAEARQEKSLERRLELRGIQSRILDQAIELARQVRDDAEQSEVFRNSFSNQ